METFKGLRLYDQKVMFENLFVWDIENGDKPKRPEFKKWVLGFFANKQAVLSYISDMENDMMLSKGDGYFNELNESYKRQIEFLNTYETI